MYGKIINGRLEVAKKVIRVGGRAVFNPCEELLEEAGYKPVYIESVNIEDGYCAEPYWEENDTSITQKWIIKPLLQNSGRSTWDVWQGKRFDVGDECVVEGRIFRVKVAHSAAWNKRPITGIDWRDYFEEV